MWLEEVEIFENDFEGLDMSLKVSKTRFYTW